LVVLALAVIPITALLATGGPAPGSTPARDAALAAAGQGATPSKAPQLGMLLADNGSPWYVTGAPDARWNDDELHVLQTLHGSDFEAVDTSALR